MKGQIDAVQRETIRVDVFLLPQKELLDEFLHLGEIVFLFECSVEQLKG